LDAVARSTGKGLMLDAAQRIIEKTRELWFGGKDEHRVSTDGQ